MPFGARLLPGGGARFRLWAPGAARVELRARRRARCRRGDRCGRRPTAGSSSTVPRAAAQTRYAFRIDGGLVVPDPASRCNPDDVHAAERGGRPARLRLARRRLARPAVARGGDLRDCTSAASRPRARSPRRSSALDDLAALGITAIELMPVADFPGRRGWGYDGVLPFAPDAAYGTPDDLKRLVAAAHARGLMVLLDVVYNHFGPDGNYLHAYAPRVLQSGPHRRRGARRSTSTARRAARCATSSSTTRCTGSRSSTSTACGSTRCTPSHDRSTPHFVDELAQRAARRPGPRPARAPGARERRQRRGVAWRAAPPRRAASPTRSGTTTCTTRCTCSLTGETRRLLRRLCGTSRCACFGRALAEGFVYQGEPSALPRRRAARRAVRPRLPPAAPSSTFAAEPRPGRQPRASASASRRSPPRAARLRCARSSPACCSRRSPPMLFMGEEFAASTPFLYFCDFAGELARAVTRGPARRVRPLRALRRPGRARPHSRTRTTPATFARSKLDWAERDAGRRMRRGSRCYARTAAPSGGAELMPLLAGGRGAADRCEGDAPAPCAGRSARRLHAAPAGQPRRRGGRAAPRRLPRRA